LLHYAGRRLFEYQQSGGVVIKLFGQIVTAEPAYISLQVLAVTRG
jgi:hypothetical protein